MPREPTAAEAIFPHLKHAEVSAHEGRNVPTLARALYPGHRSAEPQPPAPAPRPRMTREEINRAWADIPAEWAAGVGLKRVR
jgi:hypothetical protein